MLQNLPQNQKTRNGIEIITLPKKNREIFLVGFVVPTGSSMEVDSFPRGLGYLIQKMFWRGTDKHPSFKKLNLVLESMGGVFRSFAGRESIQFYIMVPKKNQHKAVTLLAEIIQHSYFDNRDLEEEKNLIIENFKNKEQTLRDLYEQLPIDNIYQNHSLGQNVEGDLDSMTQINIEQIYEYLASQFNPSKCALIASGDINPSLIDLIYQEWSLWNPENKPFIKKPLFFVEDKESFPKIRYNQRGIPQTIFSVGFLLDNGYKPNRYFDKIGDKIHIQKFYPQILAEEAMLMLLNSILGGGVSSRFWSKCVEEELLFSDIQTSVVKFEQTGFFQIAGATDNSQFTFALESLFSVLDSIKKTTIPINELIKAKEYLKGSLLLELDELLAEAIWYLDRWVKSGVLFDLNELLARIESLTVAEIRELASNTFNTNRLFITTFGTAKQTKIVDKLIFKYLE